MEKIKELTIVIPCLNEEKTLAIVIRKAHRAIAKLHIDGDVMVVDNGSTDRSVEIALVEGALIVHCAQKGYGNTLIAGFKAAESKYLLMGDADDSYNFEEIDGFIKYLREGYDLVIGTRLKGKIEQGAMPFLHRYLGTPVLTFLLNLFFGTRISDCNCGMRALTKDAFESLGLEAGGMEFASEMIVKSGIQRLKIKEIPITLYKDKRGRKAHLNTWRDGWRHLKFILLYAPNFLFIYPGILLFLIGSLLIFPQVNGPFTFGAVHLDIHFMILGLTMALLGVFIFQMGLIIKLFSHQHHYYKGDRLLLWIKKISLEKFLILGGLLVLAGLLIDIFVLHTWIVNSFQNIFIPQKALLSFYFIFIGFSLIFFAFFRAIMEKREDEN